MPEEKVELEKTPPNYETGLIRRIPPGGYPEAYIDEEYQLDYQEGGNQKDPVHMLREVLLAVRRRKWWILGFTAIVTLFTGIEMFSVRPTYSAATIVEVRKENAPLVVANGESDADGLLNLNTKLLMFKSRPLLEDVVTRLKLDTNAKFRDASQKRTWWETVKNAVGGGNEDEVQSGTLPVAANQENSTKESTSEKPKENLDALGLPEANYKLDPMVGIIQRGLVVDRIKDTQALKISFSHRYPEIAVLVANGVAQSFIQKNFESKVDKFENASSWLQSSTNKMKAKVREAEQALANYMHDHNIFTTQGQTTLTSDRLVRLHDQAMRAEADTFLKNSLYEEVRQGRVAKLPAAYGDPRIAELQKRLSDLTIQASTLNLTYGPENERVKDIQQQMIVVQEQIEESRKALEEKMKVDYERAERDEKSLKTSLEQAKGEAVQQDQAAIQYSILKQDVDTANALYTEFLHKTSQADLELAQQRNNMSIIQPAQLPRSPEGPKPALAIFMAFLLSLSASIGIAFIFEKFDTSIKNVGDVNRYAQLPTLGVIPSIAYSPSKRSLPNRGSKTNGRSKLTTSENGLLPKGTLAGTNGSAESEHAFTRQLALMRDTSSVSEAYRVVRTSVLLSAAGSPPKTILLTSGRPGEGKTTTTVNTAMSLAQLGASVLIIDADLRKPATHKGLNVMNDWGLSTYLSRNAELDGLIQKLKIPNLSLLSCGPIPPNPAELISSDKMKTLLKMAAERYDHVLIDSPPLLYVTDSVILSTLVDGVILVVHGGKSARDGVRQSRNMLTSVGAKIFGVVLNNVNARHLSSSDLTYYPYSDEQHHRDEDRVSDLLS
jgi:polysaccharide biosynthesis transport protein